jgi:hypothetical protein
MELQRLFSLLRIISFFLAAILLMNVTGFSQSLSAASDLSLASRAPAGERPAPAMSCAQDAHPAGAGAGTPALNSPEELGEQIQELCTALRLMRAEVSEARVEVMELRQDLKSAKEQLVAIKSELPPTAVQAPAQAPTVPSTTADRQAEGPQLDTRVSKLEEEQQLLNAKVDDQYQSKVESGSKYRVRLSGMALFNAFTTRGATNNFDVPDYATPHYGSEPNAGFGATARQSLVGLEMFGPTVAGARSSAEIQMDFFGGFPETSYGITTGLVRLRTAGLRLDWENTSLVAGQEAPFFSPLSPTSLVSVANPALASAGNLWVWTPQIFIEHRITLTEGSSVWLQGGLMDPLTGQLPADSYDRAPETGENSGQPAYAARAAWAHGSPFGPVSIGAGGYYERQNWGFGRMVDAWAGTADWSVPFSHRLSLTGEFYRGRAIGGLGAAEGRSIAFSGELDDLHTVIHAPNSTGGWGQLKFMALPKLEFNGAFGEDFSPTPGLKYTTPEEGYDSLPIGRNQSVFVNGIYHLRSNLIFSLEYRRLRTAETQPGLFTANQVGLGAAALF